jgi:hypothetical protein
MSNTTEERSSRNVCFVLPTDEDRAARDVCLRHYARLWHQSEKRIQTPMMRKLLHDEAERIRTAGPAQHIPSKHAATTEEVDG